MLFDGLVERQGGVVSLAQAVEYGMRPARCSGHAHDGAWRRLRPAVYLIGGHRLDDRGEVRAASLWAGEQGTIAGLRRRSGTACSRGRRASSTGRTGWSRAGELITAAADRAESAAERLLVGILRDAGITGWELGHPAGPYRIDLAFPAARVAIEVDGWAWHVDAERFRADRRKGDVLTRAGWDLLRFTWHDLNGRPHQVLPEIRACPDPGDPRGPSRPVWSAIGSGLDRADELIRPAASQAGRAPRAAASRAARAVGGRWIVPAVSSLASSERARA